ELMDQMREQAVRFGTELVEDDVTTVDFSKRPFTLTVGDEAYKGRAVIIATGASAIWLGLDSEKRLQGRGVSACATCDGFFFRNKDVVVVVGGGDTAMEEATFLTRYANKVEVVHRRDELRASKIMQERARNNPKIAWQLNKEVVKVLGDKGKEGMRGAVLKDTRNGEEMEMKAKMLFVAIGHQPNTDLVKDVLKLDDLGYLVLAQPGTTKTSIEGVFAAGDIADRTYRQAVTAAGTGCMAAIEAERWLAHGSH
ncbi:MAG TPA: FAD-dependent oxidoreductase, partial [Kofleriaceae bacterium]